MHADFMHLFLNMFGLVVFGSLLERHWGKKRYFLFYFVTAFGASLANWVVQGIEIYQISGELFPSVSFSDLQYVGNQVKWNGPVSEFGVMSIYLDSSLGASGSIYGLLIGFALLFPNTELMLLFPPIPIKAKWLALFMVGAALFMAYQRNPDDNIGHFAHLGGALFGFIMIQIWKRDRTNFY